MVVFILAPNIVYVIFNMTELSREKLLFYNVKRTLTGSLLSQSFKIVRDAVEIYFSFSITLV